MKDVPQDLPSSGPKNLPKKKKVGLSIVESVHDVRVHDPDLSRKEGHKSGVYERDELPLRSPFAAGTVDAERWMTCAGVSPNLSVLFVSDYTDPKNRVYVVEQLQRELNTVFPLSLIHI